MSKDSAIEKPAGAEAATPRAARIGWAGITVAVVFGIFYSYDLWEAISNLVSVPAAYEQVGLDPAVLPWWLLILNVLIPPAVFALATRIGLRRTLTESAIVFFTGLAVVAALNLGAIALVGVLA